ncbi:MAG: thiosulfate oxidation carrier protein SoxY [Gammaproteobacteria bacterium]|nr:thiosulfate oxidation carrier protein SoxY [Gammaproteobacteria bacterium]
MKHNRRTFLKRSLAAAAVGTAISAGLLTPRTILAAWPKSAFEAKSVTDALTALEASENTQNDKIKIKAPDIAENGAVVPISVSTKIKGVSSIILLAENNASPLTSVYDIGSSTLGYVSTRIKMGKTGNIIAIVKADGKIHMNKKEIKVTIGGCGG